MNRSERVVYLVDDDPAVRDALGLLLSLHGYRTALFADAAAFLAAWSEHWTGCVLIDIRMPGMDGLALQRALRERGCLLPVIVITGHGDVDSARAAFRSQAVDFLEKPLDETRLIAAIDEAFAHRQYSGESRRRQQDYARRLATLTAREREVMDLVIAGRHNREIAGQLAISVRTVEVHKARMMTKLQVRSTADLVRQHLEQRRDPGA